MASYQIRSAHDLGSVVADRRHVEHLSQAELARTADLTRDYVAQIEAGRSSSVVEHTFRLLRRLGATITVSFDDGEAVNRESVDARVTDRG